MKLFILAAVISVTVANRGICLTHEDCVSEFYICNGETLICEHKPVFPMFLEEFWGLFVLSALVGMANVGGIGGGGITVPLVAICWGFSTREAIALSGATIFWGSIVRFFWSIDKKHPEKKATHIDYGIVIVMLPLVIVGSATGVLVNLALPPIVLSTILTLLLVVLTIQSTGNAIKLYKKESAVMIEAEKLG
jgi:uncharacterized membrane protein YfcA